MCEGVSLAFRQPKTLLRAPRFRYMVRDYQLFPRHMLDGGRAERHCPRCKAKQKALPRASERAATSSLTRLFWPNVVDRGKTSSNSGNGGGSGGAEQDGNSGAADDEAERSNAGEEEKSSVNPAAAAVAAAAVASWVGEGTDGRTEIENEIQSPSSAHSSASPKCARGRTKKPAGIQIGLLALPLRWGWLDTQTSERASERTNDGDKRGGICLVYRRSGPRRGTIDTTEEGEEGRKASPAHGAARMGESGKNRKLAVGFLRSIEIPFLEITRSSAADGVNVWREGNDPANDGGGDEAAHPDRVRVAGAGLERSPDGRTDGRMSRPRKTERLAGRHAGPWPYTTYRTYGHV